MRILSSAPDVEQAPGVVVMMHGPGLDRFLEDRVAELARHGYAAAAPDLYHRQPDDDVDTMTRVGRLRDDEIVADVDAAVAHLRGLARPRVGELAVLGFCMGGRNTYLAAGARPAVWRAAVVFYGGNIMKPWGGDGPAPFDRTAQIACPVLGLFGLDDPNPSPADVDRIDAELTRHGKPHEFHRYPGAGHAFLNFTNAERYRPEPAKIVALSCEPSVLMPAATATSGVLTSSVCSTPPMEQQGPSSACAGAADRSSAAAIPPATSSFMPRSVGTSARPRSPDHVEIPRRTVVRAGLPDRQIQECRLPRGRAGPRFAAQLDSSPTFVCLNGSHRVVRSDRDDSLSPARRHGPLDRLSC